MFHRNLGRNRNVVIGIKWYLRTFIRYYTNFSPLAYYSVLIPPVEILFHFKFSTTPSRAVPWWQISKSFSVTEDIATARQRSVITNASPLTIMSRLCVMAFAQYTLISAAVADALAQRQVLI